MELLRILKSGLVVPFAQAMEQSTKNVVFMPRIEEEEYAARMAEESRGCSVFVVTEHPKGDVAVDFWEDGTRNEEVFENIVNKVRSVLAHSFTSSKRTKNCDDGFADYGYMWLNDDAAMIGTLADCKERHNRLGDLQACINIVREAADVNGCKVILLLKDTEGFFVKDSNYSPVVSGALVLENPVEQQQKMLEM